MSFFSDLTGGKTLGQIVGGAVGGALGNTTNNNTSYSYPSSSQSSPVSTGPLLDLNKYIKLPNVNVSADNSQLKTILYVLMGTIVAATAAILLKGKKSHTSKI